MCGIAGFRGVEADEGLAERLGRCPFHPSAQVQVFEGERFGLSGTSTGRVAGRFEIVLDGEVYNRVVLRSQLAQLGHTSRTAPTGRWCWRPSPNGGWRGSTD
ncbi:MAG: hypothetical protein ABI112_13480 [Terracoccus sp.]